MDALEPLISREIMQAHRATWYTWAGGQKQRRTGSERGAGWGYDATCSCGFETHTGGATKGSVQRDLDDHRWSAQTDAEVVADTACRECGAPVGAYCTDNGQARNILHGARYQDDMAQG